MKTTFTYKGKQYILDDILGENNFWEKNGTTIINKTGIMMLANHVDFRITEVDRPWDIIITDTKDFGTLIVLRLALQDKDGEVFYGDGETSRLNLDDEISAKYPIALLQKRAFGRGVLKHLNIFAYTTDEAKEFAESALDIDDRFKQMLLKKIAEAAEVATPKIDKDIVRTTLAQFCGIKKEDLKTRSSLTIDGLLRTYAEIISMKPVG